jgi:hypothetical protein
MNVQFSTVRECKVKEDVFLLEDEMRMPLPYFHQRQLISVSKQNIIVFASCYDLLKDDLKMDLREDVLRCNRVYICDMLHLNRLIPLFYESSYDITRVDFHPNLPYLFLGDVHGFIKIYKMHTILNEWKVLYEGKMDGAIFSTLWIPL